MRKYRIGFLSILLLSLISITDIYSSQNNTPPKKAYPEQLLGLKSISILVYVDFDIPNYGNIEKQIDTAAKRMLTDAGLSLSNEQSAFLYIGVYSYPIKDEGLLGYGLIQVRTELSDEVTILRGPSRKNPFGAITWATDWVTLKRCADVEAFILTEVSNQIDDFCVALRSVSRLAK